MESWTPEQGRTVALTAFVGVLVGAMRVKGQIGETELQDLLAIADAITPEGAGTAGSVLLNRIKEISDQVVRDARPGPEG